MELCNEIRKRVYPASYNRIFGSDRWRALETSGALPQKLLWASTGTKNPKLSDTYYVSALAAEGTVNTMPEATLLNFADHGSLGAAMTPDLASAAATLEAIEAAGVDVAALGASLQQEGADSFRASWAELLACVDSKVRFIKSEPVTK